MTPDTNKTILVTDDEPEVVLALRKRLIYWGYSVIAAENGAKAVRLAKQEKPDLIILDIDMPDKDGGEVAAELKLHEETQHIPVIFLSCLITKHGRAQGEAADSDHVYMAKPYEPHKLLEEIVKLA